MDAELREKQIRTLRICHCWIELQVLLLPRITQAWCISRLIWITAFSLTNKKVRILVYKELTLWPMLRLLSVLLQDKSASKRSWSNLLYLRSKGKKTKLWAWDSVSGKLGETNNFLATEFKKQMKKLKEDWQLPSIFILMQVRHLKNQSISMPKVNQKL